MTPADLDAIRARDDADPVPVEWPNAFDQCAKDRRALRILVDQLLEREREARSLLMVIDVDGGPFGRRCAAWLAAPPVGDK
jgi:hypothetical protein